MHLIPAHRSDDSAVGAAVAVVVDAGLFEAMVAVVVAVAAAAFLQLWLFLYLLWLLSLLF